MEEGSLLSEALRYMERQRHSSTQSSGGVEADDGFVGDGDGIGGDGGGGEPSSSLPSFQDLGACRTCIHLLLRKPLHGIGDDDHDDDRPSDESCPVCLGTFSTSALGAARRAVDDALRPYLLGGDVDHHRSGGSWWKRNRLTRDAPTVTVPTTSWLIRAHCARCWIRSSLDDEEKEKGRKPPLSMRTADEFCTAAKDRFRSVIASHLDAASGAVASSSSMMTAEREEDGVVGSNNDGGSGGCGADPKQEEVGAAAAEWQPPANVLRDENGCLSVHVLLVAPNNDVGSDALCPPGLLNLRRATVAPRRDRKRFRGNDPTDKQGGDPRTNLEKRVRAQQQSSVTASKAAATPRVLDRAAVQKAVEDDDRLCRKNCDLARRRGEWLASLSRRHPTPSSTTAAACDDRTAAASEATTTDVGSNRQPCPGVSVSVHAAVWRLPFYLRGRYTKSRRDVSQTPFYVPVFEDDNVGGGVGRSASIDATSNAKKRKRLVLKGITSVEGEICSRVANVGCGGISDHNNETCANDDREEEHGGGGTNGENDGRGRVVYGMCKFHASGREDMDVRMLLPPSSSTLSTTSSEGGRPFVCEVVDALRMPDGDDLNKIVRAINHMDDKDDEMEKDDATPSSSEVMVAGIGRGDGDRAPASRQYGWNPNGVGISSLSYATSSSFKHLQSETEDKVKHYGCLCWSDLPLPDDTEALRRKLGCLPPPGARYPLDIWQRTPLRVLHRRSSAVRGRRVLSLDVAERVDDHYFRLHLSTSAGTYVKEFVHGDCGRTVPSVASMLGGKADILELDCEGIDV